MPHALHTACEPCVLHRLPWLHRGCPRFVRLLRTLRVGDQCAHHHGSRRNQRVRGDACRGRMCASEHRLCTRGCLPWSDGACVMCCPLQAAGPGRRRHSVAHFVGCRQVRRGPVRARDGGRNRHLRARCVDATARGGCGVPKLTAGDLLGMQISAPVPSSSRATRSRGSARSLGWTLPSSMRCLSTRRTTAPCTSSARSASHGCAWRACV